RIGKRTRRIGAAPLRAAVRRDDHVIDRKIPDEMMHCLKRSAGAMQNEYRTPRAIGLVVEADAVHGGAMAAMEFAGHRPPSDESRDAEQSAVEPQSAARDDDQQHRS